MIVLVSSICLQIYFILFHFILYFLFGNTPLCTTFFINSLFTGHLSGFQVLAFMNNVIMNIAEQVGLGHDSDGAVCQQESYMLTD